MCDLCKHVLLLQIFCSQFADFRRYFWLVRSLAHGASCALVAVEKFHRIRAGRFTNLIGAFYRLSCYKYM